MPSGKNWYSKNIYEGVKRENKKTVDGKAREGNGTPLQYFCLENPMDGGAW